MRMCRFGHMYDNFKMVLFKYFKRTPATPSSPTKLDFLSEAQLQKVNEHIRKTVGDGAISCGTLNKQCRHQCNKYSAKEGADIGKYATENGATNACKNFTKILGKTVPESTAQRLKLEYLAALGTKINSRVDGTSKEGKRVGVSALPKKVSGRPYLEKTLMH